MNKKITKPVHSVIEHDEYFYRHPENYPMRMNLIQMMIMKKMYSTTFICYTFFS